MINMIKTTLLLTAALLLSGCERPPIETVQTGYRGTGMVQVFRRDQSPYDSAQLKLHGLDALAKYMVENIDGGTEIRTGDELLSDGIAISMPAARSARIYRYHRLE